MKVRITERSIRFRVLVNELDELSNGRTINVSLPVGDNSLKFELRPSKRIASELNGGILAIELPKRMFLDLKESKEEGFEVKVESSKGDMTILFEKDLKCIGRDEQINQGTFDQPKKENAC